MIQKKVNPVVPNNQQPTTIMATVGINGVVYDQKLRTKKVVPKTLEQVLYKKDDHKTLSINERTTLFKSILSKAHKLYYVLPLSLDDEDKIDNMYNLLKS
jgi:hypothetical protein